MSLNNTPRGERVHIAFFGRTNAGKSSLINALLKQDVSIVSDTRGTTTDPVFKSIEIHGVGPCVFVDTAGFDDITILSKERIKKTEKIVDKTDIAILVVDDAIDDNDSIFIQKLLKQDIPILPIINKVDTLSPSYIEKIKISLSAFFKKEPLLVSVKDKINLDDILIEIKSNYTTITPNTICGHLVSENDVVLLVMPQDIQAPKGRLILPQVQTIRDLLEQKCTTVCTTDDKFLVSIESLKKPPNLIITDSQIFSKIYEMKPENSKLTSFSVLFSKYKGDIDEFIAGANAIDKINSGDKILIAEACSHNPLDGDIGRIKIPAMLKKYLNKDITIDISSGNSFPNNIQEYSLIIHCGSCMFNRKYMLSRIKSAKEHNVPITNYGIALAYMSGILNKIEK